MKIKVRLNRLLAEHSLSPYRLARSLSGEVSQTTVYALCRNDGVRRVDLQTLAGVLGALRQLTGSDVSLSDLFEEVSDGALDSRVAALLTAPPANWDELLDTGSTTEAGPDDDAFWQKHREQQRLLERRRRG